MQSNSVVEKEKFSWLVIRFAIAAWHLIALVFLVHSVRYRNVFSLGVGLVILLWSLVVLLALRKNLKWGSFLFFILPFPMVVLMTLFGGIYSFLPLGFFVMPLVFFVMGGVKRGLVWNLAFILLLVLMIGIKLIFPSVLKVLLPQLIGITLGFPFLTAMLFFYQREIERNRKYLEYQLYRDGLTGLPNRSQLLKDLSEKPDGILFLINVDRFREINDLFGPRDGDLLLILLAKVFEKMFPHLDHRFYKLTGDEFAYFFQLNLLEDQEETVTGLAKLIVQGVQRKDFKLGEHVFHLQVSVGIANSQLTGQQDSLLSVADMALKRAKLEDLGFFYFKEIYQVQDLYKENLKWLHHLLRALEDSRIRAFYQPIYNVKTQRVDKYECLIRMILEDGTVISPFFFLGIAAKARLQSKLTQEMFRQAFKTFYIRAEDFSINLSVPEILDPFSRESILETLDAYPEVRKRLIIEVLETDQIQDYEAVSYFLEQLKKRGCRIAVDDFGSGFSNFEYLTNLPIDYLKIDGSLVKNIAVNKKDYLICKTISQFAKNLGLKTVAEFVENDEIYQKSLQLGVDYTQGYFIGKPEPDLLSENWTFEDK